MDEIRVEVRRARRSPGIKSNQKKVTLEDWQSSISAAQARKASGIWIARDDRRPQALPPTPPCGGYFCWPWTDFRPYSARTPKEGNYNATQTQRMLVCVRRYPPERCGAGMDHCIRMMGARLTGRTTSPHQRWRKKKLT